MLAKEKIGLPDLVIEDIIGRTLVDTKKIKNPAYDSNKGNPKWLMVEEYSDGSHVVTMHSDLVTMHSGYQQYANINHSFLIERIDEKIVLNYSNCLREFSNFS